MIQFTLEYWEDEGGQDCVGVEFLKRKDLVRELVGSAEQLGVRHK